MRLLLGGNTNPFFTMCLFKQPNGRRGVCNMPFLRHCSEKRCERAAKKGLAILVQHEDTGNTNIEAVQKLKSAR